MFLANTLFLLNFKTTTRVTDCSLICNDKEKSKREKKTRKQEILLFY